MDDPTPRAGGTASASRASSRLSDWSAVPSNSEGDRLLVNRRVAFFGRVFFLVSFAFYVRNVSLIAWIEERVPPFGHRSLLLHVAAMAVSGMQWLVCRSGRRSVNQLNVIDAGGLLACMAFYGALLVSEAAGFEHAVAVESAGAEVILVALVMLALVLTHAIIVPATVRRMFWLSLAACTLGPVSAYAVAAVGFPAEMLANKPWLPLNQAAYVAMWGMLTVIVSTIAARVIHGLQQRVREANEIGQYRLEEKIGEGGMGVVYLARHALLRRPTAVKLLASDRAGERAVRRFEQEVQLTSALTHPNTIAIYDFGRTPDGVFYYAMEYLDGITLEDLVAHDGPQPATRVARILMQVCGALNEAHEAGLTHRDIKPANLMLCVRGGVPDQVKVLDFGLVKEQSTDVSEGLSMTGTLVGTPAYLSPEAIVDSSQIDGRSDLYALGAVGYFLLTGQQVFVGNTLMEICAQHLYSPAPAASELCSLPVPPALDGLLLACLAKRAEDRPASASTLGVAFEQVVRDEANWGTSEAQRWWQDRAPEVRSAAKDRRSRNSTPGPLTIAVDLQRRDPRSFMRAMSS